MEEIIPFLGEETFDTLKDSLALLGILFLGVVIWLFVSRDTSNKDK